MATTLYSTDFESGTPGSAFPGWADTIGTWRVSTQKPISGTKTLTNTSATDGDVTLLSGIAARAATRVTLTQTFVDNTRNQGYQPVLHCNSGGTTGYIGVLVAPGAGTPQDLCIYKMSGGTFTELAHVVGAISLAVNDNFKLELSVDGSGALEARVWKTTSSRPSSPQGTATDTTFTTGLAGVRYTNGPGGSSQVATGFDDALVEDPTVSTALATTASSVTSANTAQIVLSGGTASGGTPSYTYQWYRSTTSGFTPGSGNLLSGATGANLTDTTATAGVNQFYRRAVTDSASASVIGDQVSGMRYSATKPIGAIGDSITFGYLTTVGSFENMIIALNKGSAATLYTGVNRGVNSTATSDWAPGGSLLTNAKAAFASAGVTDIVLMLGANDARADLAYSAATFQTQLGAICTDLVTAGYRVILNEPSYFVPASVTGNEAAVERARQYPGAMDALVNGSTIRRGDRSAFGYFANHLSELVDGLHPSDVGAVSLGTMWATAYVNALAGGAASVSAVRVGNTVVLSNGQAIPLI